MMESPNSYREDLRRYTILQLLEERDRLKKEINHYKYLSKESQEWNRDPSPEIILSMDEKYLIFLLEELSERNKGVKFRKTPWTISVFSDIYVPFDIPKDERRIAILNFRDRLRGEICELRPTTAFDHILMGSYSEKDNNNNYYDVENRLFYNIGPSVFSNITCAGIAFKKMHQAERHKRLRTMGWDDDCKNLYAYDCVPKTDIENMFCNGKKLVEWDNVIIDTQEKQGPFRYWKSLRRGKETIKKHAQLNGGVFGLKINLTLNRKTSLVSTMKPLLDGVICAFHLENDACIGAIETLLRQKRQNSIHFIGNKLFDVLGKREYLRSYNDGAKFVWNPEDNKCELVLITVNYDEKAQASFSGTIYELETDNKDGFKSFENLTKHIESLKNDTCWAIFPQQTENGTEESPYIWQEIQYSESVKSFGRDLSNFMLAHPEHEMQFCLGVMKEKGILEITKEPDIDRLTANELLAVIWYPYSVERFCDGAIWGSLPIIIKCLERLREIDASII